MAVPFTPGGLAREVITHGRLVWSPFHRPRHPLQDVPDLWRWKWGRAEVQVTGFDRPIDGHLFWPECWQQLFHEYTRDGVRRLVFRQMREFRERRALAAEQMRECERLNLMAFGG